MLILTLLASCDNKVSTDNLENRVKTKTFKQFISVIGHEIVAPDDWTVDDKGSNWTIYSNDGQASINIYTALKKGSGSNQLQKMKTAGISLL